MVLAIIFAHVWGAIELTVLGSFARTVRLRTVLLALAAGLYACVPIALLLQYVWTYLFASVTGDSQYDLVKTAGYTVDPFLEEVVKLFPVLALLRIASIRRQWSLTDCILVAGAAGAGFGLAEDIFRFGSAAAKANAIDSGWTLATGISLPYVPGFLTTLTSWLPPGSASTSALGTDFPWLNFHLVWSALGGLAVGLICLDRRLASRIAGVVIMLGIGLDHAAVNGATAYDSWVYETLVPPFTALRAWLWWMPAVALALAWWLDRTRQRAVDTDLRLAAESEASPRFVGTLRAAMHQPPRSPFSVFEFVRLRRAYYTAKQSGDGDDLLEDLADRRDRLDDALQGSGDPALPSLQETWAALIRSLRSPATILTLGAVSPAVLWFGVGGWPQTASLQTTMATGIWWMLVRLASFGVLVLLVWRVITQLGRWPQAMRLVSGDDAASFGLRFSVAAGGCSFLVAALARTLAGGDASASIFALHVLQAGVDNATSHFVGGGGAGWLSPSQPDLSPLVQSDIGGGVGSLLRALGLPIPGANPAGGKGLTSHLDPYHRPNPNREGAAERAYDRARKRYDEANKREEDRLREAAEVSAHDKALQEAAKRAEGDRVKAATRYQRARGPSRWQALNDYYEAVINKHRVNREAEAAHAASEAAKERARKAEAEADEAAKERIAAGLNWDDERHQPDEP